MMKTPRTDSANDPQPVLRTIEIPEGINVKILTKASGVELSRILTGVISFTSAFCDSDMYKLDVTVSKINEPSSDTTGEGCSNDK